MPPLQRFVAQIVADNRRVAEVVPSHELPVGQELCVGDGAGVAAPVGPVCRKPPPRCNSQAIFLLRTPVVLFAVTGFVGVVIQDQAQSRLARRVRDAVDPGMSWSLVALTQESRIQLRPSLAIRAVWCSSAILSFTGSSRRRPA